MAMWVQLTFVDKFFVIVMENESLGKPRLQQSLVNERCYKTNQLHVRELCSDRIIKSAFGFMSSGVYASY